MSRWRASIEFGKTQIAPLLFMALEFFSDLARIVFQLSKSTNCNKIQQITSDLQLTIYSSHENKKETWHNTVGNHSMTLNFTLGEKSSVR